MTYPDDFINKIICGDCLEIMKDIPDKSIDLVLTDPPYGMGYLSNHYKNINPFNRIVGDDKFPSQIIPLLKSKAKKAVYVFCRWNNLKEVEEPKSFISWVKNNWTAGDLLHEHGRQWEGILFYPMEQHSFKKRYPDVIDYSRVPPTELEHPTQKPVSLIKMIIENNTEPNDLILDPFSGSCTTAVACKLLNRRCISIEISPEYCAIGEKRLRNTIPNYELAL